MLQSEAQGGTLFWDVEPHVSDRWLAAYLATLFAFPALVHKGNLPVCKQRRTVSSVDGFDIGQAVHSLMEQPNSSCIANPRLHSSEVKRTPIAMIDNTSPSLFTVLIGSHSRSTSTNSVFRKQENPFGTKKRKIIQRICIYQSNKNINLRNDF
jgi:hypothetical protein